MEINFTNSDEKRTAITFEIRQIIYDFLQEYKKRDLHPAYDRDKLESVMKTRILDKWFRFEMFGVTGRADIDKLVVRLRTNGRVDAGVDLYRFVDVTLHGTKLHVPKT